MGLDLAHVHTYFIAFRGLLREHSYSGRYSKTQLVPADKAIYQEDEEVEADLKKRHLQRVQQECAEKGQTVSQVGVEHFSISLFPSFSGTSSRL